jgi:SAM-dependent methyltransferase
VGFLTPARRRGTEILDDPSADPALSLRSLRDVALANRLFGGRRAILREVRQVMHRRPAALSLLDVGTGIGDIPASATAVAHGAGVSLTTFGIELSLPLAQAAQAHCSAVIVGDALSLPFADDSVDIVTCSQVLHHFEEAEATRLLRECTRVAREAVIIGELHRSWFAVAGLWTSSFLLGFHPVSRHDGVVSILRGFTPEDLRALAERATGCRVDTRRGLFSRVVAIWNPTIGRANPGPAGEYRT